LRRRLHHPLNTCCERTVAILLAYALISACDGSGSGSHSGIPPASTNRTPTISGSPATQVMATATYSFTPVASDADGDAFTFEILGRPPWATFDPSNGTLAGTPNSTEVGTYSNIQIVVSDGRAQAALPAFSITVGPATLRSATLVWQKPTKNVDGSPLTDLAGYVVRFGTDPAGLSETLSLLDPELTTIVVEDLAVGIWHFTIASRNSTRV